MKKVNPLVPISIFVFGMFVTCTRDSVPFTSGNWEVQDDKGLPQDLDLTTLYGRDCLHLPVGQVAWFKDSSYRNFRMEMDVAGIAMPGFGFRGIDKSNYEYLYLRVMCDNQEDALQYLPVFNGGFSWQLYNYPQFEQKVSYPKRYLCSVAGRPDQDIPERELKERLKEYMKSGGISLSDYNAVIRTGPASWKILDGKNFTLHYLEQGDDSLKIYDGLEWIHVKLEVFGKRALFYVEDMGKPVMVIDCLKQEKAGGLVSFRNVFADSYYANIHIEPINRLSGHAAPEHANAVANCLSQWELSGKFGRKYDDLQQKIDSVKSQPGKWRQIQPDPDGLINLSRYFDVTDGTAILRTHIESRVDQQVDLLFDYAERLAISLNSEIIFSDSLRIRNNEGRVMDGEEKINLKLTRGTNELMFILTSDAYRQNWGMIARIPELTFP